MLGLPACRRGDWIAELTTVQLIIFTSSLAAVGILTAVFLYLGIRRQQSRHIDTPAPVAPSTVDTIVTDSAIQAMSARLAGVEGQIATMAASLQGVAVLQQRVASIETNMPAVQEAYEKYADQIGRADKRDTERQRRYDKTSGQSAGEAAAALTGAAGAAGGTPSPTQPAAPTNSMPRPGILGGGRG